MSSIQPDNTHKSEVPSQLRLLASFMTGSIASAAVSFLSVPVLSWFISPAEFGKFSMFQLGIFLSNSVSILGMDQSYVRFFYEEKSKGELLGRCFITSMSAQILVILIASFLHQSVAEFLFGGNDVHLLPYLGFACLLATIENFSLLTLRMQGRANLYSLVVFGRTFGYATAACGIAMLGLPTVSGLVSAHLFATLVSVAIAVTAERRLWFSLKLTYNKAFMKKAVLFGLPFVPAFGLQWALQNVDKISIRATSSFGELGLYTTAMRIVGAMSIINGAFATFWAPYTSQKFAEEKLDTAVFLKTFRMVLLLGSLGTAGIISTKGMILSFFSQSYQAAGMLVGPLLLIPVLYSLAEVASSGIAYSKKSHLHIIATGAGASIAAILCWLLVPPFGSFGAAIALAVGNSALLIIRNALSVRFLGTSLLTRDTLIAMAVLAASCYLSAGVHTWWVVLTLECLASLVIASLMHVESKELLNLGRVLARRLFQKR